MITLRHATIADITAINDIYNHFIVNSAITFDIEPWDIERRTSWFNQMQLNPQYIVLVALKDNEVVGFAFNSPYNTKAAYSHSTEVTIYKSPACNLRGVGKSLYKRLLAELTAKQYHRAYALITLPNTPSFGLHASLGFNQVGLLSEVGEKNGALHDVALFEKAL